MSLPEPLHIGHVELRPAEFQVLIDGVRAGLTVREFQLLLVLAERHDRVVQRPEVYGLVWGGPMPHRDRSVDVFVRKVRRKLTDVSPEWTYIHTHFAVGYRFALEPTPAPAVHWPAAAPRGAAGQSTAGARPGA